MLLDGPVVTMKDKSIMVGCPVFIHIKSLLFAKTNRIGYFSKPACSVSCYHCYSSFGRRRGN